MLLSNNEKMKDDILKASGICLWEVTLNLATNVFELFSDDRLAELFGVLGKEISANEYYNWWFAHMDDESKGAVTVKLEEMFTTDTKDFELQYMWHKPQNPIYVRTAGRLVSFENGIAVILGYTQDISAQYATTIMLEKQVHNFELASEIGNYAVFELEHSTGDHVSEGVHLRTNNLFSTMFGKKNRVTNIDEWNEICSLLADGQCKIWCSLVDNTTWVKDTKTECELSCTLEDGTHKWLSLTYKVYQSTDSKLRVIGFIKDISVMKLREAQLEDANNAKSLFLANMSHEIRTPMNAVINFAKFMRDTELDDTQKVYVDRIVSSSTHMLTIMNDILDFSKIEANKMTIEKSPYLTIHENHFIKEIIAKSIEDKNIIYTVYRDPAIPVGIIGDAMRMRQILINILSNAIKFTHNGGKVSYEAHNYKQTDDTVWLKFVISDNGIGMTEEQLSKLFSAFTQADTSITRRFGGTGLGLAITKMLLELMDGEITVESEVGKGTTFTFIVPFGVVDDEQIAQLEAEYTNSNMAEKDLQFVGLTCLIAEDNFINQEVVRALFKTLSVDIHVVNNGMEALNEFKANGDKYDCIFMDVQMPVMDGYSATQNIRALEGRRAKDIPIFALTANAVRGEGEKSLSFGMNEHLTKPLSKTEILKTLAKYFPEKILSDSDIFA